MTPEPGSVSPVTPAPRRARWLRRTGSVVFIIFCLELGLFLLVYPWTDSWSGNYFSWIGPLSVQPAWHSLWNNSYVRGAVSGLGLVNVWLAVSEALRMFAGNDAAE